MKKGTAFLGICILFIFITFRVNAQLSLKWQLVQEPGLPLSVEVYETHSYIDNGKSPLHAIAAIIDLTDPNITINTEYVPVDSAFCTPLAMVSTIDEPVYVAINGGYFDYQGSVSLIIDNGTIISQGKTEVSRNIRNKRYSFYPTRGAFGINNEKKAEIAWTWTHNKNTVYAYQKPNENNYWVYPPKVKPKPTKYFPAKAEIWKPEMAMGGGPVLLKDGKINITASEELFSESFTKGRHPRTAIGVTKDNELILLVVDGRQAGFSVGVTLPELAEIMQGLGATDAVNLDGGGSSVMLVNKETVTSPSDAAGMRKVPSILTVSRKAHIFDTEDTIHYAETAGDWRQTIREGHYGKSRARIAKTGKEKAKASYAFHGIFPAKYRIEAWWVPSDNGSPNAPFTFVQEEFNRKTTVRVNQADTTAGSRFHTIGTFHTGENDRLTLTTDADGDHVCIDAIRLKKVDESLPEITFNTQKPYDHVKGSEIDFDIEIQSPNTGVSLKTFRIFMKIGDDFEAQQGADIQLNDALSELYHFTFNTEKLPLDSVCFRFEVEDCFERTVSKIYNCRITPFEISYLPNHLKENVSLGDSLHFGVLFDTGKPETNLTEIRIYRKINSTCKNLIDSVLPTKSFLKYQARFHNDYPVGTEITYHFVAKDENNRETDSYYSYNVSPKRGDTRLVVINDINQRYGSTDYHWRIDSTINKILKLKPDMVVCAGDMIAGQSNNLTEKQITDMWRGFETYIYKPLTDAGIEFGFTFGNHDASFDLDKLLAKDYWTEDENIPDINYIDKVYYPFYYSFTTKDKNIFFVTLNAAGAFINEKQLFWLEENLKSDAARNAKYRIVVGHLPLFSLRKKYDNKFNVINHHKELLELFEKYDVKTYISGHHGVYFPGKKNGTHLLCCGEMGTTGRKYIGTDKSSPTTMTMMDLFYNNSFNGKDTVVYTTYDIHKTTSEAMRVVKNEELPHALFGFRGHFLRYDIQPAKHLTGNLSSLNLANPNQSSASGIAEVKTNKDSITISGNFKNLQGKIIPDFSAIALYEGRTNEEGMIQYPLTVFSNDGKNGIFKTSIPYNENLPELLTIGNYYLLIKTNAFPDGEIRTQLYPKNNLAPSKPEIISHRQDSTYIVYNAETYFTVEWQPVIDPEHNPVAYIYQLFDGDKLIWQHGALKENKFTALHKQWFQRLRNKENADKISLFHRVVATDGNHTVYGNKTALHLSLKDRLPEKPGKVPAPNYDFDRVITTVSGSAHGVTLDKQGKIWVVSYQDGLVVYNRYGVSYRLQNSAIAYSSKNPAAYIVEVQYGDKFYPVKECRGIAATGKNEIVLVAEKNILILDSRTGKPYQVIETDFAATNPAVDSMGNIYLASVYPNKSGIILKRNTGKAHRYEVSSDLKLFGRELSRALAVSPDGKTLYLPSASTNKVAVYQRTSAWKFSPKEVIELPSGRACNAIQAETQSVYAVAEAATHSLNLFFTDFAKKRCWEYVFEKMTSRDIRGMAFSAEKDTLCIAAFDDGRVYRYIIRKQKQPEAELVSYKKQSIGSILHAQTSQSVLATQDRLVDVSGIVITPNFSNSGLSFSLASDSLTAVTIVRYRDNAGYMVKQGDSISVTGKAIFENGMMKIYAETISTHASSRPLPNVSTVSAFHDRYESSVVRLERVKLLDRKQWQLNDNYFGFSVEVVDSEDNIFTVFIRRNSDLYEMKPPRGKFGIQGVLRQFDTQYPLDSGWYLMPRYAGDLIE